MRCSFTFVGVADRSLRRSGEPFVEHQQSTCCCYQAAQEAGRFRRAAAALAQQQVAAEEARQAEVRLAARDLVNLLDGLFEGPINRELLMAQGLLGVRSGSEPQGSQDGGGNERQEPQGNSQEPQGSHGGGSQSSQLTHSGSEEPQGGSDKKKVQLMNVQVCMVCALSCYCRTSW